MNGELRIRQDSRAIQRALILLNEIRSRNVSCVPVLRQNLRNLLCVHHHGLAG